MSESLWTTKHVTKQVGIAVLLALVLGTVANVFLPRRIAWVEDWGQYIEAKALAAHLSLADLKDTRKLVEAGEAILFDARPMVDYQAGHIPGALSFSYDPFETIDERLAIYDALLAPEQQVVTYCSGTDCDESFMLATFLKDHGFTNVLLYVGGWGEWQQAEKE